MAELNGKKILFSPRVTIQNDYTAGDDIDISASQEISVSPNEINIGNVTTSGGSYSTTLPAGTGASITKLTAIVGYVDTAPLRATLVGEIGNLAVFNSILGVELIQITIDKTTEALTLSVTNLSGTGLQVSGGQMDVVGVKALTTAPTANNTDGDLKVVVLASEPATKYSGYLYIITEASS